MHFSPLILFHSAGGADRPSGEQLFSRKTRKSRGGEERGGGWRAGEGRGGGEIVEAGKKDNLVHICLEKTFDQTNHNFKGIMNTF